MNKYAYQLRDSYVVDAIQFDGNNFKEICDFIKDPTFTINFFNKQASVIIKDKEYFIKQEDYIVRYLSTDLYNVLNKEDFESIYKKAEEKNFSFYSKKIGIFYKDLSWGKDKFDEYISNISLDCITSMSKTSRNCECTFKDGGYIKIIPANESSRGCRLDEAIIQTGIDKDIINCIIRPIVSGEIREVD